MRTRTRPSLALAASAALLIGACSKSTPQVDSSATTAATAKAEVNKSSGGSGGGNSDGGNSGGDTITVDALVARWEKAAADKGLDPDTTQCVSDNIRKAATSSELTTQQANNAQSEAVQICAEQERQRHEIIVGGPTTTF